MRTPVNGGNMIHKVTEKDITCTTVAMSCVLCPFSTLALTMGPNGVKSVIAECHHPILSDSGADAKHVLIPNFYASMPATDFASIFATYHINNVPTVRHSSDAMTKTLLRNGTSMMPRHNWCPISGHFCATCYMCKYFVDHGGNTGLSKCSAFPELTLFKPWSEPPECVEKYPELVSKTTFPEFVAMWVSNYRITSAKENDIIKTLTCINYLPEVNTAKQISAKDHHFNNGLDIDMDDTAEDGYFGSNFDC